MTGPTPPPARAGRTAAQRRERAAAMRAAQRRRDRRRRGLLVGGAAAVLVVLVAVGVTLGLRSRSAASPQILPAAPAGKVTVQSTPRRVADTSGIRGVLAWDTGNWPGNGKEKAGAVSHQHVTGPVRYAVTPPVGGPHNPVWMNAGAYTAPIPNERAVHNLEHGAVWITYRPDLPEAQVTALTAFVARQSFIAETGTGVAGQANRYLDLSPWSGDALPAPIVISAWGHQLRVSSATDPRLQRFVDVFRNSRTYTPEYGSAVDGIPVRTGGRAAADGSRKPNPAGSAG